MVLEGDGFYRPIVSGHKFFIQKTPIVIGLSHWLVNWAQQAPWEFLSYPHRYHGGLCIQGMIPGSTRGCSAFICVCVCVCVCFILGFVIRVHWRVAKNYFKNHWNFLNILDAILGLFLMNSRIFSLSLLLGLESLVALEFYFWQLMKMPPTRANNTKWKSENQG